MKKQITFLFSFVALTMAACNESDPAPADETELITTVELHFTEVGSSNHFIKVFKDPDGAGGNNPTVQDEIVLEKGKAYNMEVLIKNESDPSDIEDITEEIEGEDEDHQFFFTIAPSSLATQQYSDEDSNKKPVGLKNKITAGNLSGSGKISVILRHKPDKSASGVATGNPANAGGETDVEVDFNLVVQ